MFTGIVVERGTVKQVSGRGLKRITVEGPQVAKALKAGDSVAVNGVCLTAVAAGRRRFTVEAMAETLGRSTLGELKRGTPVNLELAARLDDRLGGHLVQGHVDGVAVCKRIESDDTARRMWFALDESLLHYMVPKGSVTLDGVSLTIVEVGRTTFQVAIIPHTLKVTTFGDTEVGRRVNVEIDVIAKYVERLSEAQPQSRSPATERR